MAGTKDGSIKSSLTIKQKYGINYYKEIGAKSWFNPERSRKTGFALMTPEQRAELGRKGGKKTKNEYKEKFLTEEEATALFEQLKEDSSDCL